MTNPAFWGNSNVSISAEFNVRTLCKYVHYFHYEVFRILLLSAYLRTLFYKWKDFRRMTKTNFSTRMKKYMSAC